MICAKQNQPSELNWMSRAQARKELSQTITSSKWGKVAREDLGLAEPPCGCLCTKAFGTSSPHCLPFASGLPKVGKQRCHVGQTKRCWAWHRKKQGTNCNFYRVASRCGLTFQEENSKDLDLATLEHSCLPLGNGGSMDLGYEKGTEQEQLGPEWIKPKKEHFQLSLK